MSTICRQEISPIDIFSKNTHFHEFGRVVLTKAPHIRNTARQRHSPHESAAMLLVGSFTPEMQETDDEAIKVARIYVDTETALVESGDLVLPIKAGSFDSSSIQGTLTTLSRSETTGRISDNEITLFKGVGTALEDLTAASLAYDKFRQKISPHNTVGLNLDFLTISCGSSNG